MPREKPLRITASFQDAVKALLQTPPPPGPIRGSRANPKKKQARKKKRVRR